MKKLALSLDSLKLESFEVSTTLQALRLTVKGHGQADRVSLEDSFPIWACTVATNCPTQPNTVCYDC